MTQVASAEQIFNTRCLAVRQAEWMGMHKGHIFHQSCVCDHFKVKNKLKCSELSLFPACPEARGKVPIGRRFL